MRLIKVTFPGQDGDTQFVTRLENNAVYASIYPTNALPEEYFDMLTFVRPDLKFSLVEAK